MQQLLEKWLKVKVWLGWACFMAAGAIGWVLHEHGSLEVRVAREILAFRVAVALLVTGFLFGVWAVESEFWLYRLKRLAARRQARAAREAAAEQSTARQAETPRALESEGPPRQAA